MVWLGLAAKDVVAVAVADRKWIATSAVAQREPTLKVDRPHVIGLIGNRELVIEGMIDPRLAPPGLRRRKAGPQSRSF